MTNKKVPTKVIFPVRIGQKGVIKNNLFDDLIEKNPNFYTAIPDITATAADRVIRYWRPYETFKVANEYSILWNISFLTAMVAHEKTQEMKELENKIKSQRFSGHCSVLLGNGKEIKISEEKDDMYLYRIRFLFIPNGTLDSYPEGNLFKELYTSEQLEHISFNDNLVSLKDKIVIVGSSNPDNGDLYPTPIGDMAGMYIIGNAINTILFGLQPSHSSMYVNILIEFFVIIVAAYCFLYFNVLLAQIIASVIFIFALGIISYYYFLHTGVFLNFTFAVVGMSFHRIISNIEEIIEKKAIK